MSLNFQTPAGQLQALAVRLADNSATTIVGGDGNAWFVPWLAVGETSGGTPNLTVALNDGVSTVYLTASAGTWNAKAMTAKQGLLFDAGYIVPSGGWIKVTSSDASGHMDVSGVAYKA